MVQIGQTRFGRINVWPFPIPCVDLRACFATINSSAQTTRYWTFTPELVDKHAVLTEDILGMLGMQAPL